MNHSIRMLIIGNLSFCYASIFINIAPRHLLKPSTSLVDIDVASNAEIVWNKYIYSEVSKINVRLIHQRGEMMTEVLELTSTTLSVKIC